MNGKFICECGTNNFYFDEKYAELICKKCGRIYRIEEIIEKIEYEGEY